MNWAIETDIGKTRSENQDNVAIVEKQNITLAILCDGMGGHHGGALAAKLTINTIKKEFLKHTPSNNSKIVMNWCQNSLEKSQKLMQKSCKSNRKFLDMGTTITIAIIFAKQKIYIFNVGDSRTYIFNDKLHQITIDHNLKNHYILDQGVKADKASAIFGASMLTSALGPTKTTKIDAFEVLYSSDIKYIILTSDGLHNHLTENNFSKILALNWPIKQIAKKLITVAKVTSTDNLSVALLKVN